MQKIRPDMDIGNNIQKFSFAFILTLDQVFANLIVMGISM